MFLKTITTLCCYEALRYNVDVIRNNNFLGVVVILKQSISAKKWICERATSFTKYYANAGTFFPLANVSNFAQAANPVATEIAVGNLVYSVLLASASAIKNNLPEKSRTKKFYKNISAAIHDETPTKNPLKRAFRFVGCELSNPLRVTSYCALGIGGLLLAGFTGGASVALFPGLAAIFFGVGNYIQSSSTLTQFRDSKTINPLVRAVLHPSVWYGIGYAATGVGIGGGLSLLANPTSNVTASLLTSIGIAETAGSLWLMASGNVKNKAAPFVGVAIGTTFFAATGLVTGNVLGAATGIFACAGELSLAVVEQKQNNAKHTYSIQTKSESKIESLLTSPIRMAMNKGWINPMPAEV